MQFNITYEDITNCQFELKTFNNKNSTSYNFNDITKFLKSRFNEALTTIYKNEPPIINYHVRILQHSKYSAKMAYFDAAKSSDLEHYIFSYYKALLEEYHEHQTNSISTIGNVMLHELSHSADQKEIFRISNQLDSIINSLDYGRNSLNKRYITPKILHFLAKLRNEGVATFIEDIMDNSHADYEIWMNDAESYMMLNVLLHSFDNDDMASMRGEVPYILGKHLLLNTLYYKYEFLRPQIDTVVQKIKNKLNINIADFGNVDIFPLIFEIRLEEFIFVNLQSKISLPLKTQFSVNLLDLISHQAIQEGILESDFDIEDVSFFKYCDKEESLKDLHEIVGKPMLKDEIENQYLNFQKESYGQIFHNLLSSVYDKWKKSKDVISAMQLTYVFDEEDIIPDKFPIVGIIDDMFILDL
jgi:hypothetical protein